MPQSRSLRTATGRGRLCRSKKYVAVYTINGTNLRRNTRLRVIVDSAVNGVRVGMKGETPEPRGKATVSILELQQDTHCLQDLYSLQRKRVYLCLETGRISPSLIVTGGTGPGLAETKEEIEHKLGYFLVWVANK